MHVGRKHHLEYGNGMEQEPACVTKSLTVIKIEIYRPRSEGAHIFQGHSKIHRFLIDLSRTYSSRDMDSAMNFSCVDTTNIDREFRNLCQLRQGLLGTKDGHGLL